MKNFLRKQFYNICKLIYQIGAQADFKSRIESYHQSSIIAQSAQIANTGSIDNNQDKSSVRIGENAIVRGNLMTFGHGGEIIIGNDTFIGPGTRIWSSKRISIGERVLISHNVHVLDNNSHPLDSEDRYNDLLHIREIGFQQTNDLNEKNIIIKDDVWIGFNATILKGVIIGKGAIIGANTIIRKSVPDYAIVVGNPPKIIKYTT